MSETTTTKGYGFWVVHCPCGWDTLGKRGINPDLPKTCEACKEDAESAVWYDGPHDVACFIATVVEKTTNRLKEHAEKHGLYLYKLSPRRYVILTLGTINRVPFRDGEQRVYQELILVKDRDRKAPASFDYQEAMKYIRDHTPDLPEYLKS